MPIVFKGPEDAPIVFVGEFHGYEENSRGIPFIGQAGQELNRMIAEAGFFNNECAFTNVVCDMPPGAKMPSFFYNKKQGKELKRETLFGLYARDAVVEGIKDLENFLALHPRRLVIGLGNLALWAMTGITGNPMKDFCPTGITRWRSSIMMSRLGYKFIPTFNPANVLYNWPDRWIMVQDLRRCRNESEFPEIRMPKWKFLIQPSFKEAMDWMDSFKGGHLVADIETSRRQISCVGLAKSVTDAICIPFMTRRNGGNNEGYWNPEEELAITLKLKELLTRKTTKVIFHHAAFDCHYFAYQWGYIPHYTDDTMLLQHVLYPGLLKSLAFCSSLYEDYHLYWKEDNKERDRRVDDDQHWTYCCTDCVRTFGIFLTLKDVERQYNMQEQYQYSIDLIEPVLEMLMRGLKVDVERRERVGIELQTAMAERSAFFETVLGHKLNPNSHPQMHTLFYEDFNEKAIHDRKTKERTLNDDALQTIAKRTPLLRPLIEKIEEFRSLRVFHSNYIKSSLPPDNRMRPGVNMTGAETYRFSMSKDIFGDGTNMQTIPSGSED